MAACVNPTLTYLHVRDKFDKKEYIVGEARVNYVFERIASSRKSKGDEHAPEVLEHAGKHVASSESAKKNAKKDKKAADKVPEKKEKEVSEAGQNYLKQSELLKQLKAKKAPKAEIDEAQAKLKELRALMEEEKARQKELKKKEKLSKKEQVPEEVEAETETAEETEEKSEEVKEQAPAVDPKDLDYEIIGRYTGADLKGLKYQPLFTYFVSRFDTANKPVFTVLTDGYVTAESGTGIVHQAPAFGEDDNRVCKAHGVIGKGDVICPIDASGHYTNEVADFAGRYVKEADKDIIKYLKKAGRLVDSTQFTHSYPHCWRSDTPLIYRAIPSWFVNVTEIKKKLVANNQKTYWVPQFIKEKKFHNWLEEARDWAVSRNRYWGTPMPIWVSDDEKEIEFVGSIAQLEERSGIKGITDLHRDKIDGITFPSKRGPEFGVLKRVPEVFDCWFESGSMPYAQQHYPFENKEKFLNGFPADFIAEGIDQTRGWFYTLMVISTALFDQPPFKNLIVNGLVLASDGKKMSKRLNNYPDPMKIVDSYGSDALRLYLINSPAVRGASLQFMESGVKEVVKSTFIPWFNCYKYFVAQARRYEKKEGSFVPDPRVFQHTTNTMDKWILASLQTLVFEFRKNMDQYFLSEVVPCLLTFLDDLSRWYVRFNKPLLKGDFGKEKYFHSLSTLFHVLFSLCKLMAPFTPFLVEAMYQNLRRLLPAKEQEDSVHYLMVPTVDESSKDPAIERQVKNLKLIIDAGRIARETAGISFKTPLPKITIADPSTEKIEDGKALLVYIQEQMNAKSVVFSTDMERYVAYKAETNNINLGSKERPQGSLGKLIPQLTKAVRSLDSRTVDRFRTSGTLTVQVNGQDINLTRSDVDVKVEPIVKAKEVAQTTGETVVIISTDLDDGCVQEGVARTLMSHLQKLRKAAKLTGEEDVVGFYRHNGPNTTLKKVLDSRRDFIQKGIKMEVLSADRLTKEAIKSVEVKEGSGPDAYQVTLYVAFR